MRVQDGALLDRQPDGVPPVPDPDPVRGPDRGLHVRHGPPGRRVVRRGSARSSTRSRRSTIRRHPSSRTRRPRARRGRVPRRRASATRAPRSRSSTTLSFRAEPGQTTAIVGSTGSGKSTLVNLIPRFYDATGGTVLVDGVDVRAMDREDLWSRIGVIPQKAFLFSGTVASNLRFGEDRRRPTTSSGAPSRSPRARDFVATMDGGSRPRSPRAARTSRAASASASRSPGRSSRTPGSTSSTTASRPSTSRPTRASGRRSTASSAARP